MNDLQITMICDECKKKFVSTPSRAINNGLAFQTVEGVAVTVGLCDKHQWRDVAKMNQAINRMYGW